MRLFYLAGVAILAIAAGGDATGFRVSYPTFPINIEFTLQARASYQPRGFYERELLKSSKVTDEQLQKWLSKGKAADTVFYRMDLVNARITTLFESPQFIRWLQYADDLSATGKGTPAISVLSTQYGDDTLHKMIEWAKKESNTKALGTRLQADQLEHWVTTRKDPDKVFKLYDLNYAGRNILSHRLGQVR
ncbi:hypothetical protein V7S43_001611 [Phytophthora oleae]|uniref:RxLR effector PexRD54 WY domain-containing protein n=1 Tax=Phytophthora oleae TaxID=2107226 RepID=A0ABD3G9V3_9STRA